MLWVIEYNKYPEDLCHPLNIVYAYCWQPNEGKSKYPRLQYAGNFVDCLEQRRVKLSKIMEKSVAKNNIWYLTREKLKEKLNANYEQQGAMK